MILVSVADFCKCKQTILTFHHSRNSLYFTPILFCNEQDSYYCLAFEQLVQRLRCQKKTFTSHVRFKNARNTFYTSEKKHYFDPISFINTLKFLNKSKFHIIFGTHILTFAQFFICQMKKYP